MLYHTAFPEDQFLESSRYAAIINYTTQFQITQL